MIIALNILLLSAVAIVGYMASRKGELKIYYWPGLALKIISGFALGLLYTHYYSGGDSLVMFNEATRVATIAFGSPGAFIDIFFNSDYSAIPEYTYLLQPRAAFMTKILAIPAWATNSNYWLTACYLSMFSFFGFWLAANTIYNIFGSKTTAVVPTFYFPSIVFWSSGVLKESLAISSLVGVLAILINTYYKKRIGCLNILLLLLGLFLILYLKYYYAAMLIVSFTSVFITRLLLRGRNSWYIELASVLIVFSVILGIASLSHPNFWPSRFLGVITNNYYQFIESSSSGNVVRFHNLAPTISSFLFYSPKALFAGIFYPLGMISFNILKLASVVENWVLLLSFIYAIRWFKMPQLKDDRLLLWTLLLFVITTAVFITFSTPNLGTLARFKIGYMVVFVTLVTRVITNRLKME